MLRKVSLVNGNPAWDENKRYSVNEVVSYNGNDYQNTTGKNSNPELLNDWIVTSEGIKPYTDFRFVIKGFGNTSDNYEAGDVFQGWVSDGVYSTHSVWDGTGALNDEASFDHKQTIEY